MNEKILALTMKVAADITLSDEMKQDLLKRLSEALTEEEIEPIEISLSSYWQTTQPLVENALARVDSGTLSDIVTDCAHTVSSINTLAENYTQTLEKNTAENILIHI